MEIFTAVIIFIVSLSKTVNGDTIPPSGICESEVREIRPRFGPYVETFTEFYRKPCLPQRFGLCIYSRAATRHTVGLQHEVIHKKLGKCCEGYKQTSVAPLKCEPICSARCTNGRCKRPDECECDEGYERASKYVCKPICTKGCANNSVCAAPDTCRCAAGYEMNNNSSECVPKCTAGCTNGICTAPETCTCHKGYRKSDVTNFSHICVPVCTKKCVNGVCIAPDQCMCIPDYAKNATAANWYTSNVCIPAACVNCRNGYCTDGNVCKCHTNYEKDPADGQCKPVCSRQCVNGQCLKPEQCACNAGYEKDAENPYVCNPKCSQNCENGWCTVPEECSCLDGYSKVENSSYACEPICEQFCQNGSCVNNTCVCDAGFALQPGDKYKCSLLQTERLAEITGETTDEDVLSVQTKLPCIFNVKNAIKTETASSCILFNENMAVKTKYACKYLNQLTKNVCVNRFCEENNYRGSLCKSFLHCYVITEYVKSLDKNEYSFDCSLSKNVTQYDYAVDLNDTVNESNFTDWFSVDMRIDWFDFSVGKIKPFVVVDDSENADDSCEWCMCPVDLRPKCDGTPFQLHICSCPRKSASYYKPSRISTTFIVLGILGAFSVIVGFVTVLVLTGHYFWRRHREKNDPLKYKEQAMSCKFENTVNYTTRELISDDEDSDTEGNAVTLRI